MKNSTFDFMKCKGNNKKEINISFTQCQDKNLNQKKKTIPIEAKEVQSNQKIAQIEISFWQKSIEQMEEQCESLRSFLQFKEKGLSLLKYQSNLNKKESIIQTKKKEYENKLAEILAKFEEKEIKLNDELIFLSEVENLIEEHTIKKYQIKKEIERLKTLLQKNQNEKKNRKNTVISFNRIDTHDIQNQYKGLMTTTAGEMCKSRLGNKLLLSLNVEEINKHQVFDKFNLAYPVLQKKKIQYSYFGDTFNTKKLGKKKIDLNDFNNFKINGFPDGIKTVY